MEYTVSYYVKAEGVVIHCTKTIGPSLWHVERFVEGLEGLLFGTVTRENEAGEDILVSEFMPRNL